MKLSFFQTEVPVFRFFPRGSRDRRTIGTREESRDTLLTCMLDGASVLKQKEERALEVWDFRARSS